MASSESAVVAKQSGLSARVSQLWRRFTAPGAIFYASTMLANAIGYVFFFIMARLLELGEYGELVTLTALVYVFSVVTRSMQAKTAQSVTTLRGDDVPTDVAGGLALRQSIVPLLVGTLLITLVGLLVAVPVASFLKLRSPWPVVALGMYVATHYLLAGPRGLLLGSSRLYYLSIVTIVDPFIRVIVALALVLGPLGTSGALLGYVVGNLAATLLAVLPFLPGLFSRAQRQFIERARVASARLTFDRNFLFVLVANGAMMALASVDPVAVRRYFSETVAGTYAAAFLLGRIIMLSTNAMSWVVFSRTVHLRPGDPRAGRILAKALAIGGGLAALMTAGFWIAPGAATMLVGGSAFRAAGNFVGLVGLEMVLFAFVSILAYYHMAIRNTTVLLPFVLSLGLEAVLIVSFHATPYQIIYNTLFTLAVLLAWVAIETVRVLRARPVGHPAGHSPRMAMVVHSHYPADPRVRREAEALLEAGWSVDVLCVPDDGEAPFAEVNSARIFRLPVRRNRMGSQLSYLLEYGRFFLLASLRLARLHLRQPYQVVQVHNMPDFLVFTALVPRLMGARVVLDVHDLVPEFYALRYGLPLDHPIVRVTRWVQAFSARFADHVLTAGEPFRREIMRNARLGPERVTSIMNSPDPHLFSRPQPEAPAAPNGRLILAYHGTLSEYNDLTLVLRAMAALRDEIPGLEFRVLGRGRALPGLVTLAAELGLGDKVQFMGYRPLDEMPSLIGDAHLGVVPQRRSVFTAMNFPTKAFEYIVLGIPVVMSHTPALEELFGHVDGVFFTPDHPGELIERIRALYADWSKAQRLLAQEQTVVATFAWPAEKQRYQQVLNTLGQPTGQRLEPASA